MGKTFAWILLILDLAGIGWNVYDMAVGHGSAVLSLLAVMFFSISAIIITNRLFPKAK